MWRRARDPKLWASSSSFRTLAPWQPPTTLTGWMSSSWTRRRQQPSPLASWPRRSFVQTTPNPFFASSPCLLDDATQQQQQQQRNYEDMAKAIQRKAEARFRSLEQRRSTWSAEDEAVEEDDVGGKKKWRKHDKSANTKYQRGKEAFVKKTKTGGRRRSKGREGGYEMDAEIGGEGGGKMREPITREDRASQKYLQTKAYMLSDLMSSAKKGQVERCNRIFEEMKAKHIKPDTFIFDQLLIAHSHHGRVKQALKLYNSLKKHGNHPSIFTFNILFNTFANFEPPASFSPLHQKSTRDDGDEEEQGGDNEVGSTHNSKYLDRIRWLKEQEMKRYSVRPNIETYNCLLKAYMTHSYYGGEREVRSGRGALANVLSTLTEMREQGLAPNVSTYTFLMGAIVPSSSFSSPFRYRRFSDEDVAQLRYELQRCNDSAKERQNKKKSKSKKKTDEEGAREGEEGKEEETEAEIEERLSNLKPTSSSSVEQMFELWEEMKRNVTPDLRSYNQLMKACSDSHKTEEQLITFEVYKQMIQAAKASSPPSSFFAAGRKQREAAQKQPPFPDVRTFDILFTTCNKLLAYQMARELFETQLVPALGLRHAYRQWKQQQQRVSLMPKNHHGEEEEDEEAQEEEEQDENYNNDEKHEEESSSPFPTFPYYKIGTTATMKVDEMMFVKVLKACCMDNPEFVENVLYVMRRKKVSRHDKRTLETLIQVYGRAKQVDRVRSLYQEMKKTTLIGMSNDPSQKMNLKSYTIALTACRDCGDTALAFQVVQDMLRLGGHEVVSTMDKVFARLLIASLKETQMKALLSSSALEDEDEQEEKSKQPVIGLPEPQRELLRRVIEQEKERRFWGKKRKKENMRMKWQGLGRIEGEEEEGEGEHEDDGQGNEVTGFEGSKREESDFEDDDEEDEEDEEEEEEEEEVQQRRRRVPESKKKQRNAKIAAVKAMYQRKQN